MYRIYKITSNPVVDFAVELEDLKRDYFTHAYGENWQMAVDFLEAVDKHMPQTYMEAKHSARQASSFYNPAMEKPLGELILIAKEYEQKFAASSVMPIRVQTVAMRLMRRYAQYIQGLAGIMAIKCLGKDEEAKALAEVFFNDFGRYELEMERYYDHYLTRHSLNAIFNTKTEIDQ